MLKINAEHDPCYKNIVKPCTNFLPLFIVKLGRGGEDRALKIAVKLDLYHLCMILPALANTRLFSCQCCAFDHRLRRLVIPLEYLF